MENSYIETDLDVIKYLNSKTCNQIINMLEGKNLIGRGFWGFVYKLDIKGHKISAKIQPLSNNKTWDPSIQDPRNINIEIDLLKTISHYKITNSFIHFPYFYKEITCKNQNIIFYEYYSSNLKDLFIKLPSVLFEDFKNISIQILVSIYFFQQVTGYYHNDIHVENFLVNYLDQPIEQTYNFVNLGLNKSFIFNKFYIGIWDFANAIPIPIDSSNSNITNVDYIQFKQMFSSFIKKIIDQLVDHSNIIKFCVSLNIPDFSNYYDKELKKNKLKWSHIKNPEKAIKKFESSTKKSFIYWIIENKYLDQMIKYLKAKSIDLNVNLPTQQMLDWISNLPNSLEDAISLF